MKPKGVVPLDVRGCTIKFAKKFVEEHHSHLPKVQEGLFATSVIRLDTAACVCVGIVGRPGARKIQEREPYTVQISWVASDGSAPNAASMAIAALAQSALRLGWLRVISYTMLGERGSAYRAGGWRVTGITTGGEWDTPSRRRKAATNASPKIRWEIGPEACTEDPSALVVCNAAHLVYRALNTHTEIFAADVQILESHGLSVAMVQQLQMSSERRV